MHGEIWVQSPSPVSTNPAYPGSRFSFTIEVYSNEKLLKPLHHEKISQISQINALIISGTPQSRQQIIRVFDFEKINYSILDYSPEQFSELEQKLSANKENYHLLVIFDEPGISGLALAKKIKDSKLADSFLMMMVSKNHKIDNFIQSRRFGIDYYFFEPFEQSDVMKSLAESFPYAEKSPNDVVRKIKSNLNILVAEDNEINIRVAQTIFSNLGYKIDLAHTGAEAAEKVRTKNYDIIFMDLIMPEKDGIQATVDIRGMGYQMPIVAMTATASTKSKSKAISSGMNDYIVKPVKMDAIRSLLIKWFA
jgi:CheY-like chemotaxis protein